MKLTEALKSEDLRLRISCGVRWMYFDDGINKFVVMERLYRSRKLTTIIETDDEDLAVEKLLDDK
jgi:hypothetical protein